MKTLKIIFTVTVLSLTLLWAMPALSGTTVADTFSMETKEIKERKKAPPKYKLVTFTHKKHFETYKIACGECHHDKNNKPLSLKMGDPVQRCVECHTKLVKDKKNRKDIMVLENAMHGNCITCHKDVNKAKNGTSKKKGPAPVSCGQCHEKG